MSPATLRFAPSPNGRLHLGHAYSALLNGDWARRLGGRWLLRIEDIDPVRSRPEHVEAIVGDLAWLGLRPGGPVRRQSARHDAYAAAATRLRHEGLLYPCFCTRGAIARAVAGREAADGRPWPRDPDGSPLYPGTCRPGPGESSPRGLVPSGGDAGAVAWRLDTARALQIARVVGWRRIDSPSGTPVAVQADPARWGDPVLVRKDTPTSYHLAVVVDDADQRISHVVRGRDLEAATDLHALLQRLLALPSPLYHHHRLITDPAGAKLAKSEGARSLADLRAAGVTPGEISAGLGL